MIFIYSGKNFENKKKAFESDLKRFLGYERVDFDENNFDLADFSGLISARGLFDEKYIVVLKGVLEDELARAEIFKKVKELESSENVFFFLESGLTKTDLKPIEKKVKNINFFDVAVKKEEKFNVFAITDAFARKDKKGSWVMLQKALKNGVPAMDVANILTWSLKSLILVKDKKGSDEDVKKSGLNPFVFKKALSASRSWEEEALKKALQNIVFLYHDDRRGEDLATDLELFVLKTL
jgi:DNA polymerase III delta subunit